MGTREYKDGCLQGILSGSENKPMENLRANLFLPPYRKPARGTLMGNRGILHDDQGLIIRPFTHRVWVTCLLEFKGRHRQVMTPGRYTHLFFLDEATALAAGHRPCGECRQKAGHASRCPPGVAW